MSEQMLTVDGLGKKYRIRHDRAERYVALRDVLTEKVRALFQPGARAKRRSGLVEEFWALRDVTFQVARGEVVGVIGRNGAGKSTLLKVLSRVTEPTEGRVELSGGIASLLEVGTGFHPELTGKENVFLNGAILGMSRVEIRRKLDEIVAFAGVERFLDTPVKRYSSGMYVRLAFSVIAHLESEILVVDEVLSVGDVEFQNKCLGKMQEVSKSGRTVLFVSHNMAAVQALCSRAVLLDAGRVSGVGDVDQMVSKYLSNAHQHTLSKLREPVRIDDAVTLVACELMENPVESGRSAGFLVRFTARAQTRLSELSLLIYTKQGARVGILDFRPSGLPVNLAAGQSWMLRGNIKSLPLVEGEYYAGLYINTGTFNGDLLDLVSVSVVPATTSASHAPYAATHRGIVTFEYSADALTTNATPLMASVSGQQYGVD